MTNLLDTLPLTRLAPTGHYGRPGEAGITVTMREDLAVATLVARKGAGRDLAGKAQESFGIALPDGPRLAASGDVAFLGTGPGRWLALSETRADLADALETALGAHTAVTEQSDANILFELSGARVLDLLGKGVAIDLDPVVFRPGDAAVTIMALIGVVMWRQEDGYRCLVARSFAAAFCRFLVASGAEYGLRLQGNPDGRG